MKTARKIFALMAVLIMTAGGTAASVRAAAYTAVKGTTMNFNKYLVIDKEATVPAVEFTFGVTADVEVEADEDTLEVKAGPSPELVVVGTKVENQPGINGKTAFTLGQITTDGTATDGIANSTDRKYATNSVTVDFSKVEFTEPGVYRYIITETEQDADSPFKNDDAAARTVDVYVENDETSETPKLKIGGYVMYKGVVTAAPKKAATDDTAAAPAANGAEPDRAEKSSSFINTFTTYNLTFGKKVTGNQGSKDKYFEFTLSLTGAEPGVYAVDITKATDKPQATAATTVTVADNPDEITVGNDGTATQKFYLQHGQSITVKKLAKGTKYTVQEKKEEYTAAAKVNDVVSKATLGDGTTASDLATFTEDAATKTATVTSKDGGIDVDTTVEFTNNKVGVIPTGILLSATPWIIAGVIVIAGIIFFAVRSRKKYDEE